MTVNDDLAIAAAEAGHGIVLADQFQAGDALIAGRLVRPLDIVATRLGYYLVRRPGAKPSEASVAFEAWLVAEIAAFAAELRAAGTLGPAKGRRRGKAKTTTPRGALRVS
jgi:LysR family glycine cleavage system transcriptional activator